MLRGNPRGFFIEYAYADSVPAVVPTYQHVEAMLETQRASFAQAISTFSNSLPDLRKRIAEGSLPWDNPRQFPRLDFASTYCIIRELRPNRILEIGSGTSTFVLSAALTDNGSGSLKCIDPNPRKDISDLAVDFERRLLVAEDVATAQALRPGDVLFIDSSHRFVPGCDVDIEFNRLFPALPSGAFVHIHDIFLPDGYPEDWYRRHYAEQNALIGWLLSGYFEVHYPGYFAATRMVENLESVFGDLMPRVPSKSAGSIWLRKR
jgi:predicted O-methyltransferase YrrM